MATEIIVRVLDDQLHRQCKIVDVDPNEGTMIWECSIRGHCPDRTYESLNDVINAAEVHLEYQCIR